MTLLFFLLPLESPGALYAIFFGMMVLASLGAPIPEEITLLFAGYLAYLGFTDFWTTVIVLSLSIVAADFLGYSLGRFTGDFVYKTILGRFEFTRELLEKGRKYIDRFGAKVIFLTRPIVGVRFVVPIMMGHFRMDPKKFFCYDLIAAIPYAFIFIWLSYYLGSVFTLIADFETIKHILEWVIGGVIAIWIISYYIKKRRLRMGRK